MEKSHNFIKIIEQYISPQVLPKEQACAWIKWENDPSYEKIILRYEADVQIFGLLNVDEEIFNRSHNQGIIEIPKSMMQVKGFFGFTAFYTTIPERKREISYSIDFVKNEKKQTVTLTNFVTRPEVEIVSSSSDQIILSEFNPSPKPLSFDVINTGEVEIKDPTIVLDVITTNDVQIKMTDIAPLVKRKTGIFTDELPPGKGIYIKGKGNALIRLVFQYKDILSNNYSTILKEIPIRVEQKTAQTIPINHVVTDKDKKLLYVET